MTNNKTYSTTIEDAGDGSGDGILTFPPEILEEMGWKEGTLLNVEEKDGNLYITEVKSEKTK
jgi:bifunctional DNA-binding transcriptional regulator/antitoxin component of YhaV-PrlF toxin-antitoxin module